MKIDNIDRKIISALIQNSRIPMTELAQLVGLSVTPCRLRLTKLESEGYILGYGARVNHKKLGHNYVCFVEVKLESTDPSTLKKFNDAISRIDEIEQAHLIAGSFDYLLKVRTSDVDSYREVLGDAISRLPSVRSTSTNVSMQSIKEYSKDDHLF